MKVLLIHGVGHTEADQSWHKEWEKAIMDAVSSLDPDTAMEFDIFQYDRLFSEAKIDKAIVAEAMARLMASGVYHGIGDFITGRRGFVDDLRWTAGMVAQWTADEKLREKLREKLSEKINEFNPNVVCAHSLGSLLSYDLFASNAEVIKGRNYVTYGSQIGNPFVRSVFGGRIIELKSAVKWYHLYNSEDAAFAAPISLDSDKFKQVSTYFDIPGMLDHDAVSYLRHVAVRDEVWKPIVKGEPETIVRSIDKWKKASKKKPVKRALLVGINEYPNPAMRLEGCVNDVYLMSEALQEIGFEPDDIRVVLNDRATAKGILERLEWLLEGAGKDDARFFFYSGHGTQIPGYGAAQEADHVDECLVPHDFDWSLERAVTDDQFHKLYSQLPYDTNFIGILDCCHSGGMTRDGSLRVRGVDPPDDIRHRSLRWDPNKKMWLPRELGLAKKGLTASDEEKKAWLGGSGAAKKLGRAVSLWSDHEVFEKAKKAYGHHGPYMPILMEACKEDQFAHEYRHGALSYGAFTYCLVNTFRRRKGGKNKKPFTFKTLIEEVEALLKDELKFHQTPMLVCPKSKRNEPLKFIK